jgi:hypothetical protein
VAVASDMNKTGTWVEAGVKVFVRGSGLAGCLRSRPRPHP